MLGEIVTCLDFSLVLVSFVSVMIIIHGMNTNFDKKVSSAEFARTDHFNPFAFTCLIGVPVFVAI